MDKYIRDTCNGRKMNVCIFLYANDVVLLVDRLNDLQPMLGRLYDIMNMKIKDQGTYVLTGKVDWTFTNTS